MELGNQRTEAEPVGPRMKVEPDGAEGAGRLTADQGGARGTREPREAICTGFWLSQGRG